MDEQRSDQITRETRIVGGLVIIVLVLAFLALYVEPQHTDQNFAWTILPSTSAILIGAGYTAGAFFFARLLMEQRWHRVQAGFLPITAFTVCMLAATLLHWSRFHHGTPQFYLWFIIYLITPFAVPFLWWRNRPTAAGQLDGADLQFSRPVRWALGAAAGVVVLGFVWVFAVPSALMSLAPWKLTELTARVFAGWSILTLLTTFMIALDGRWSAARILVESACVGLALCLVALPRMWSDLDPNMPMRTVLVAGMALAFVGLAVLHIVMDLRVRRSRSTAPSVT